MELNQQNINVSKLIEKLKTYVSSKDAESIAFTIQSIIRRNSISIDLKKHGRLISSVRREKMDCIITIYRENSAHELIYNIIEEQITSTKVLQKVLQNKL